MTAAAPSTVDVVAENTLTAFNRIVSVLRMRRFPIVSITAMRTSEVGCLRLAVVTNPVPGAASRIARYLEKIEEVHAVRVVDGRVWCRELAVMTLRAEAVDRPPMAAYCENGRARVIDRGSDTAIVEMVADPQEIDRVIDALAPDALIEIARIGPALAHALR